MTPFSLHGPTRFATMKRVRWRGWWTPVVRRLVSIDYGAVPYKPQRRKFASYW